MEFKTCAEFAFSNLEKKIKEYNLFKKKIYIYQYSSPAKLFITYLLEKQINIIAIVDIRNDKLDKKFLGIPVIDIKEFETKIDDDSVLLCERGQYEKCILDIKYSSKNRIIKKIISIDVYNYKAKEDCLEWKDSYHNIELKEVHDEMLDILKWFHEFCEDNNLYYVLYSGSLIGAIRHGGIIPWDDDIDVIMPAGDYLKCCKMLSGIKKYEFKSIFSENNHPFISTISKLTSKHYRYEERNFPLRVDMGIGMDIWPLGGVPENEDKQLEFSQELENIGNEWKQKVVIPYGTMEYKKELYEYMVNKIKDAIKRYDIKNSRYVSCVYCGTFGFNGNKSRVMLKEDYLERKLAKFEQYNFWIPKGYDKILRTDYGDYMEIPSIEKKLDKKIKVYYR